MKDNIFSRRSFLKGALAGTVLLMSAPSFASELIPQPHEEASGMANGEPAEEPRVEIKGDMAKEGRLRLYRNRTDERIDVVFRNAYGEYDPEALAAINRIMRCHYNGEETGIDIQVIEYLNALDNRIGGGGNEINIVSGYRSREYNDLLRKRSRRVAKHSFHLTGQAIDFHIPSAKLGKVRHAALKLGYGGVGYYPKGHFIHIDSGKFRYW
ncbi:MAG: DUF882 domain-containing protein [Deltaproteobacteria bacterium]|nr:DUF882 domain-containing protein [Deltaproteobacteria bacterium]